MQITLLPPLLPTEGVTSVPSGWAALERGARVVATVVRTGVDGERLLLIGGRQVPVSGGLPFPAGTRLQLEVVEPGAQPLLRVVTEGAHLDQAPSPEPAIGTVAVSRASYGLASAVLAATGPDVPTAAAGVAVWIPALVARGMLTAEQGAALLAGLRPVDVPPSVLDDRSARQALAEALERRVAGGGLLLDRQLADLLRGAQPLTPALLQRDLRIQLAFVARMLADAADDLTPAREAVTRLQQALLAEQARTAAHLAAEGSLSARLDVVVPSGGAPRPLRLRFAREAPDEGGERAGQEWPCVRFDLPLGALGQVQVALTMTGSDLRAEFIVERAGTADAIEAGLLDLTAGLEAEGFRAVWSRVVVDPVRACAPDTLPDLPPPHAILDARA